MNSNDPTIEINQSYNIHAWQVGYLRIYLRAIVGPALCDMDFLVREEITAWLR